MTISYHGGNIIRGTAADRTGGTWTNLQSGYLFVESDTQLIYYWNGTVWSKAGGAPQGSAKITVYSPDAGTNWIAKSDAGLQLTTNTSATTVLQYAVDNLTAARTVKETVKVMGSLTVGKITIPSYTVLDLRAAKLTAANATNDYVLVNNDLVGGNTQIEIIGGYIDGNKANQTTPGANPDTLSTIHFGLVTNSLIEGPYIINSNRNGIRLNTCTNVSVMNPTVITCREEGVSIRLGSYNRCWHGYFDTTGWSGVSTNTSPDCSIFDNKVISNQNGTSGLTINGLRNYLGYNESISSTGVGIALAQGALDTSFSLCEGNIVRGASNGITANSYGCTALVIRNNIIDTTASGGTFDGIAIAATHRDLIIEGNVVHGCYGAGIRVLAITSTATQKGVIRNNTCYSNGRNGVGHATAGITLKGVSDSSVILDYIVEGNRCYDDGLGTQTHGLELYVAPDRTIVRDNDFRNNVTAAVSRSGDLNTNFITNQGYTPNWISAGISASDTTFPNYLPSASFARWGLFEASASSSTCVNGMYAGLGSNTAVGSGVYSAVVTSALGTRGRYQTGTTINSICGGKIISLITERDLNPWVQFKTLVNAITTVRFYLGFMSTVTAPVSAADYLANLSGVGFFFDSSVHATNIAIMQNDGSATSNSTTIAAAGTLDTNAHTFAIRADNANSRFQYSFDGAAWGTINTKIPTASTTLTVQWFCECLAATASRNFEVWYVEQIQDP